MMAHYAECPVCGRSFPLPATRGHPPVYCSRECNLAAERRRARRRYHAGREAERELAVLRRVLATLTAN